jgi:hypothetical protein
MNPETPMNPDTTNEVYKTQIDGEEVCDLCIREATPEEQSKLDNVLKHLISEDKDYK